MQEEVDKKIAQSRSKEIPHITGVEGWKKVKIVECDEKLIPIEVY